MVVSFVGFTFLLHVVLSQFVEVADYLFLIGLTMGLVWVPCAGPALGFALTLVREQPGLRALLLLSAYAFGTALPLLLVGYGGQWASQRVRSLTRFSGRVKSFAGWMLIATALALQFQWLRTLETWLVQRTSYGTLGTRIEEQLFRKDIPSPLGGGLGRGGQKAASSISSSILFPVLPKITRAPEFKGLGPWHNSRPLTLKELRGKVVLVDFWTYSCINCIRTLPHIQGYWEKFGPSSLVVLGIHSPEFVFEKSEANVADAIRRHGLTYPIAQDNDFATWRAFANHYWPAKYLVDTEGYIRYTHFGEGAYEETAKAIQSLLEEAGAHFEVTEETDPTTLATDELRGAGETEEQRADERRGYRELTPETYLGARSWPAFAEATVGKPAFTEATHSAGSGRAAGKPAIPDDDIHQYVPSADLPLHNYTLGGDWQLVESERQVLRGSEGEIRMRFLGGEINLVLGLEEGVSPVAADVWVDGKKIRSFMIDHHDLYRLFKGAYGEHEMTLLLHGKGVSGYAFTFGS